jgi:predicted nicotinamide N-methyase
LGIVGMALGQLRAWDLHSGAGLGVLDLGSGAAITAIAVARAPGADWLAVAAADGTLLLIDARRLAEPAAVAAAAQGECSEHAAAGPPALH